jgi:DNA phosphorothioation-associated putative methyltransferase
MQINRQKTAMSRPDLSRPVKQAIADGKLTPDRSFFDYGCGKGGDVKRLSDLGYQAAGYDPFFAPDAERLQADVVALSYVVNVIEDQAERADVLRQAWSLARGVLVVSARMADEASAVHGEPFGDGILTTAGTFQHFFTQAELRGWIDSVLGVESVAAASGIFYVFRFA